MDFLNDLDKMYDFMTMNRDEFLKSYPYLTTYDYYKTYSMITPEVLADLMRDAENVYIENLNDRDTGLVITGAQFKEAISDYAQDILSFDEYREYIEICESMGV